MTVPPLRRDALPVWVSLLLAIFAVATLVTIPHGRTDPHDQGVDDAVIQDLLTSDLSAKSAYAVTLSHPGPVVRPDRKLLRTALTAAESLESDTANAPSAARRVILLRALLRQDDTTARAKSDAMPLAVVKGRLDPLAAFTTALPPETPAINRAAYAREGQVWKTAFDGGALTPGQIAALSAQIERLPNIRWWRWVALSDLQGAQGDLAEANVDALAARAHALGPLAVVGALGALRVGLTLAGVLVALYLIIRRLPALAEGGPKVDLWPTLPERLPVSERRLGAGDLMTVFVLFLIAENLLALVFEGSPGVGHAGLLRFPGLLSFFRADIQRLPSVRQTDLDAVLEASVYLLSAAVPVAYLVALARRRGASLAAELGWTTRDLGRNIGYGVAGFALASLLLAIVSEVAPQIFPHAPTPSNPAIPLLAGASSLWAELLMLALASVAAPLFEELLFRGVFYNAVKLLLGVWPAILLTGLTFGLIHPVGISERLAIAVLGGVFAWMAETRKSLVPGITGHFLLNFTTSLLLLFALAG